LERSPRPTIHNMYKRNLIVVIIYEARLLCKDGSIRDVSISSNVFWKDRQFIHTRCLTRDLTDRKQAKAELQRQNLRSQIFAEITLKIHQSLQLESLLQTTVNETELLRQLSDQIGIALAQAQMLAEETRYSQELVRSNTELQQLLRLLPMTCKSHYEKFKPLATI